MPSSEVRALSNWANCSRAVLPSGCPRRSPPAPGISWKPIEVPGVVDLPRADDDHLQLQRDHLGGQETAARRPSSASGDSIFNWRDCRARSSASQTNGSAASFRFQDQEAAGWPGAAPPMQLPVAGERPWSEHNLDAAEQVVVGRCDSNTTRRAAGRGRWPGSARYCSISLLALASVRGCRRPVGRLRSSAGSVASPAGRRRRPGCCCTFHRGASRAGPG